MFKNFFFMIFALILCLPSAPAQAQSAREVLSDVAEKGEEVLGSLGRMIFGRRRPSQPRPQPQTTRPRPQPQLPQVPRESELDRSDRLAREEAQRQELAEEQRLRAEAAERSVAEKAFLNSSNFKEASDEDQASNVRRLLQNISSVSSCRFPLTFVTNRNVPGIVFSFDQIIAESYPFSSENGVRCARSFLLFYIQHKFAVPDPKLNDLCKQSSCTEVLKAYDLFIANSDKLLRLISSQGYKSNIEHGASLIEIHRALPGSSEKYPNAELANLKAEADQVTAAQQSPDRSQLWALQQRSNILYNLTSLAEREQAIDQLTSREELAERDIPNSEVATSGSITVELVKSACAEYKARSKATPLMSLSNEDRARAIQELRPYSRLCYISAGREGQNVTTINFKNDTPNDINPTASESGTGASREFHFEFPGRTKRNMALKITDNAALNAGMSANLLETTIVFIPRKVVPYIELDANDPAHRKLILPTGESVTFDAVSQEIKDGALEESTIDVAESRHTRKFANVRYTGNGISIRVDRRAGTPEHIYSVAFNSNERIREATVSHKGKVCYVSKSLLWQNAENPDLTPIFKYSTDQEFLDVVANRQCKWNLTMRDIE